LENINVWRLAAFEQQTAKLLIKVQVKILNMCTFAITYNREYRWEQMVKCRSKTTKQKKIADCKQRHHSYHFSAHLRSLRTTL